MNCLCTDQVLISLGNEPWCKYKDQKWIRDSQIVICHERWPRECTVVLSLNRLWLSLKSMFDGHLLIRHIFYNGVVCTFIYVQPNGPGFNSYGLLRPNMGKVDHSQFTPPTMGLYESEHVSSLVLMYLTLPNMANYGPIWTWACLIPCPYVPNLTQYGPLWTFMNLSMSPLLSLCT